MADWRKDYIQYRRYFFDIVSLYKRRQDLRAFLEILLSIGTIALFVLLAIRPTVVTISQLLTELKEKEETIAKMDTKIRNLQIAQGVLGQNSSVLSILEAAIPNDPTPENQIKQIQAFAQRNNVSILGLTTGEIVILGDSTPKKEDPTAKKIPSGTKTFTFSGTFTANYDSLVQFLADIEKMRRPVVADTISFTTIDSDAGKRIVLSVSGRIGYLGSVKK